MADESFVDIQKKGASNLREVRLTPEDIEVITENPGGLTVEGCLVRVGQWAASSNQYVLFRYLAMYKKCSVFAKSGETPDGKIILARRKHTMKSGLVQNYLWTESKDKVDLVTLRKLADSRLSQLVMITTKGG